jgi:hypothetical protein
MLCYERDRDRALVLAAGVPWEWVAESSGVRVRGLRTPYGLIGYTLQTDGDALVFDVAVKRLPPGGMVLLPPQADRFRVAEVDGKRVSRTPEGGVVVRRLSARVVFRR